MEFNVPDRGIFSESEINILSSQNILENKNQLQGCASDYLSRQEIVFIDSDLDNYQDFLKGVDRATEIVILNSSQNGIEQITSTLSKYERIDSIHLVSHASWGNLFLGSSQINLDNLHLYQNEFHLWQQVLTKDADILLYGCNLAAQDRGREFVRSFSQLTGADLAASMDVTGNIPEGGNWQLEFATGTIDTTSPFTDDFLNTYRSQLDGIFNLKPEQILNVFQQFGNALESIGRELNTDSEVPFFAEEIENIVDFANTINDLSNRLVKNELIGETRNFSNLQLENEAIFYLKLNNSTEVGIRVDRPLSNFTIEDLVFELNLTLQKERLSEQITVNAISSGSNFSLNFQLHNPSDSLSILRPNSVAENQLGLLNGGSNNVQLLFGEIFQNFLNINIDNIPLFANELLEFKLQLNERNSFAIALSLPILSNINTLKDLINGELNNLGLNAEVRVSVDNNRLIFNALDLSNNITILEPNTLAQEIGFLPNLTSDIIVASGLPKIVDLIKQIPGVDRELTGAIYDPIEKEIHFNLALTKDFDRETAIALQNQFHLNLGGNSVVVSFSGGGESEISSTLHLNLGMTIDLKLPDFVLTEETLLSSLNNNRGIETSPNQDLEFHLQDGSKIVLDLDINDSTTLGQAIAQIERDLNDRVKITLDRENLSLIVTDRTLGDNQFSILAQNESLAGFGLGILGFDSDGKIIGSKIGVNLTNETLISSLNNNRGMKIISNQPDLKVSFGDGSTFLIDFNLQPDTTLADIIEAIASDSQGRVVATINSTKTGLDLSALGNENLTVESINNSLAGIDLGIIETENIFNPIIRGKNIGNNLKTSDLLSSLNNGTGVRNSEGEIAISLRDGTNFVVNFVEFDERATIDRVFEDIVKASDNKLNFGIDLTRQSIVLIDTTFGTQKFTITPINNATTVVDLGIGVTDTDGNIIGTPLFQDSLSDRLYFDDRTQVTIQNTVSLHNLDLIASLGILELGVKDGTGEFSFDVNTQPSNLFKSQERVSLTELLNGEENAEINLPSFNLMGDLTFPVQVKGLDNFNISEPVNPQLNLKLENPFEVSASLTGLENIEDKIKTIANLSLEDFLRLAGELLDNFLNNQELDLNLFNRQIPLLNKSLKDLIGYVDKFVQKYADIQTRAEQIPQILLENLEQFKNRINNSDLFNGLSLPTQTALLTAFATVETLIAQLPANPDLLSSLSSAIANLQNIITNIPQTPIATWKNILVDIIADLPTNIAPELFHLALAKLEESLQHFIVPEALELRQNFETIILNLNNLARRSSDDVETFIKELKAFLLSLPSNLDANIIVIISDEIIAEIDKQVPDLSLVEVKLAKIKTELNNFLDSSLVETALDALKIAKANLLTPELARVSTNLREILDSLDRASVRDLPTIIARLESTIFTLPTTFDRAPFDNIKAKLQLAFNSVDFQGIQEGITLLQTEIGRFPTPELKLILDRFDLALNLFAGTFINISFNELGTLIPNVNNLSKLLFDIFNLELPIFEHLQEFDGRLDRAISLIPSNLDTNQLRASKDKLIRGVEQLNTFILSQGLEEINKAIESIINNLPESLQTTFAEIIKDLNKNIPNGLFLSLDRDNNLNLSLDINIVDLEQTVSLDFSAGNFQFINTTGNLNINLAGNLSLDMGLDLSQELPLPYLLPSNFTLNAGLSGDNLDLELGINNLLKAEIDNGTVFLNNGKFVLKLEEGINNDRDGKIFFNELDRDNISVDLSSGNLQANLPVFVTILGQSTSLGSIKVDLSNWIKLEKLPEAISFTDPDFLNKLANIDLDEVLLKAAINKFLDLLQRSLASDILTKLPLIGEQLDLGSLIEDFRQQIIQQVIDSLGTEEVIIPIGLQGKKTIIANFDLGLSGLNFVDLNARGGVAIDLAYDFVLNLGISKTRGVFFQVDNPRDIYFDINVRLQNNTSINANLFLLKVIAQNTTLNEIVDNKDYNQDGDRQDSFTTAFKGILNIDIVDPNGDDRLTIPEISQAKLNGSIDTEIAIALKLQADLNSKDLPSIETNLFVFWQFGINDELELGTAPPIVSLNDISLNIGSFISKAIGPLLKNLDTYIELVRPILDFLEREIPIISELSKLVGLGKFTVIDGIGLLSSREQAENAKKLLKVLRAIDGFLQRIKNFDEDISLNFGDYDFQQDLRLISPEDVEILPERMEAKFANFEQALTEIEKQSLPSRQLIEDTNNSDDGLGIAFPILDNPLNIFKLLFGQTADLITWDLPEFKATFAYQQKFPIFPPYPIFATLGGSLTMFADLSLGLDTRGIQTGKFLDGFYFGDRENVSLGRDIPELGLIATFAAGLEINVVVAAAGIEGGLQSRVLANWHDPNNDGKLYYDEILSNVNRRWMCVFDFSGLLAAFLDAYVKIGLEVGGRFITIYEHRVPLFYEPLFDFSQTCPPGEPKPILAHYSTGTGDDEGIEAGTLILNVGRFANLRQPGSSRDDGEEVFITQIKPGTIEIHSPVRNNQYPPGAVQVFGDDAHEGFVERIYIDSRHGNDYIIIDDLVTANSTILGGQGDDYIETGSGKNLVFGDRGHDTIISGLSEDTLDGEEDNDLIRGGGGNDSIFGGSGDDDIEAGDGDDTVEAGANDDRVIGGSGKDILIGGVSNLDALQGFVDGSDFIAGDGDDDTIVADNGSIAIDPVKGIIAIASPEGGAGNDTIYSGDGNHVIIGGGQNDLIFASQGRDRLLGDLGYIDNTLVLSLFSPILNSYGDDTISSGDNNNIVLAGGGNDLITAESGFDVIFGDNGTVRLDRDVVILAVSRDPNPDGDDAINSGDGDSIVIGGNGNDAIATGKDFDVVLGDSGIVDRPQGVVTFVKTTQPENGGNDTISTSKDDDLVIGGNGNDRLLVDDGKDIIIGDSGIVDRTLLPYKRIQTTNPNYGGNDTILAGQGDDIALGGTGNDRIIADMGEDIAIGDNGTIVGNDIFTHSYTRGGVDIISGGTDNDIILGGSGDLDSGDALSGNDGDDLILGDNGKIERNSLLLIETITTTKPELGGNDALSGGNGNDILIAGKSRDTAQAGKGQDIVLGDNGLLKYNIDGTLNLVTTTNPTLGEGDAISGNEGNDLIFGGTADDRILAGSDRDLVFGDHGKLEGAIDLNLILTPNPPFTFTSIHTQLQHQGGDDLLRGESGDDLLLGQQGKDTIFGDTGDDDMIGGHNINGGDDADDSIDGGSGNDAIAGDNGVILRQELNLSLRFRTLRGTVIYNANGQPQVTPSPQLNPTGALLRKIVLLNKGTFGNDAIAGGANEDIIFGQLGDDTIQGDSSILEVVTAIDPSQENTTDGDDYIEGGGGNDLIFGNLGQDDLIGDNSSLFVSKRLDGQDTIFGGAGTEIERNYTSTLGHVLDADVILGDNGNIFRLVDGEGNFLTFNYDNYSDQQIIPRAIQQLDLLSQGDDDLLYGESGDDIIYGMKGNDIIFGDAGDDDLYGGSGADRLYGGTGEDGILGDSGQIFTLRNGQTEPLYGVNIPNLQTVMVLRDGFTGATFNFRDRLKKQVVLNAIESSGNDIIYGGLGDDFLHAGAGDDAISGAEAMVEYYHALPIVNFNPLEYNPLTRKLAPYDAANPRQKIPNFFLNFDAIDPLGNKIHDGRDNIFGDLGNDWLVGGTNRDRLFGGMGDDLLDADDNRDGNNDRPDLNEFADPDFTFGGGGLDVAIANTGKDRLFDWNRRFNTYIVPFETMLAPTIRRIPSNELIRFLVELAKSGGADVRKQKLFGEIGLVTPEALEWEE
jgi:Ca2+-binding RTX toxin-like protein